MKINLKINIFIIVLLYYKYLNGTTSFINKERLHNEVVQQSSRQSSNCSSFKKSRKKYSYKDASNIWFSESGQIQDDNSDDNYLETNDNCNISDINGHKNHIQLAESLFNNESEQKSIESCSIQDSFSEQSFNFNDNSINNDSNDDENDDDFADDLNGNDNFKIDNNCRNFEERTINQLYAEHCVAKPDWSMLYKPISLYRAIKRYHNCNWFSILIMFSYLGYLIYLTTKTMIYAYIAYKYKSDRIIVHRFYRPMYHFLEPTLNVQLVFWAMLSYTVLVRTNFLLSLINNAIINEKRYVFIKPSQIAIGYVSLFNLTYSQWRELFNEINQHDKSLNTETNKQAIKLHLSTTIKMGCKNYKKFKQLDRIYQKYYLTMLDSRPCHKGANKFIEKTFKEDKSWSKNYHKAQPLQICDLSQIYHLVALTIGGACIIAICIYIAFVVTYYMHLSYNYHNYSIEQMKRGEHGSIVQPNQRIDDYLLSDESSLVNRLWSSQFEGKLQRRLQKKRYDHDADDNINDNDKYIPKYVPFKYLTWHYITQRWFTYENCFAAIDDNLFLVALLGTYVDCSCILYCVIIYYSRCTKVRKSMELLLENIREASRNNMSNKCNKVDMFYDNNNCKNQSMVHIDVQQFNAQLMDSIEKIGLLLDEIVDLQLEWSYFMDILVMTNILLLSFNLVFFPGVCDDLCEYALLFLSTLNSVAPLWVVLVIGSSVARSSSKFYFIINKLLVNEGRYMDKLSITSMLNINARLENEGNRAFLLFRTYAITPLFVLKLIAWVSSIVIVLRAVSMRIAM